MIFFNFRAFLLAFSLVTVSNSQVPDDLTEPQTDLPSAAESSTSSLTESSTTATNRTTPDQFVCSEAGGPFPDPSDCKKYHLYSDALVDDLYECPGSSYFNELTLRRSSLLSPRCADKLNSKIKRGCGCVCACIG